MFKKRVKKEVAATKRKLELESDDETSAEVPAETFKRKQNFKSAARSTKTSEELQVQNTPRNEEAPKPKPKLKPASENIKIITITDFQPDVCKDFLQTGYCGYGDTCKFLHVRDESKQNKPLVKDWQIDTNADKPKEVLPVRCVICKSEYKNPIKTQCGHPFCKECFLTRYRKKKHLCFVCQKETNGVMIPIPKQELKELEGNGRAVEA